MANVFPNEFVTSVVADFVQRYPQLRNHVPQIADSDGDVWIECGIPPCRPRLRSFLTFGVSHDCITVAFDGRTRPIMIRPPYKDAETARREAFDIFDNLLTERYVAFSYVGGESDGIEWISRESVDTRNELLDKDMKACDVKKWIVKIRSWSGKYDKDIV